MTQHPLRGYAASLSFTFIFAMHYLVAKEILPSVDAWAFGSTRGLAGGLILAVIFHRQLRALNARLWIHGAAIGVFGFCINQILFLEGLKRSTPADAAVVANLIPLAAMAVAVSFKLERLNTRRSAGLILGAIAVSAYLLHQMQSGLSGNLLGNSLMIGGIASLAISLSLAKKFAPEIPGPAMTAIMLGTGGLILSLPAYRTFPQVWGFVSLGWWPSLLMAFAVLISTAGAYLLNIYALRHLPVSRTMAFAYLQPVFTAGLMLTIYGTWPPVTLAALFAALLVSGWLVLKDQKPKTPPK